jgi:dolichol-phosphate mannosyltransferase
MADELTIAVAEPLAPLRRRTRTRVRHEIRQPATWFELARFAAVGASGYVVNLVTFAACVHVLLVDYRVSAVVAFLVAVANNFTWNRLWTFDARDGHAGFQAVRFLAVSVGAFIVSFGVLQGLVDVAGTPKVAAQAIAIVVATPFNFIGNKLWSFSR